MVKCAKFLLSLVLALAGIGACAHGFPGGTVKIVVGFSPGGATDTTARLIASKLSDRWGEPVIVENKPGASGTIAAADVVRSKPDGRTILLAATSFSVSAAVYRHLSYNALDDLAPVILLTTLPSVLVVNPTIPASSPAEFVALAKSKPGSLNYASAGVATSQALAFELLKQLTGIHAVQVPFKGSAPAIAALLSGRVQAGIILESDALPYIRASKLRALAVTVAQRSRNLPDVPTLAETVAPGFDAPSWQGISVPATVPHSIVRQLNHDVNAVLADSHVRARLTTLGLNIVGGTPQVFRKLLKADVAKWTEVARKAHIEVY